MEKKLNNLFKGDKIIWMVFFFLCVISIIEVFSASSGLTYKSNNYIMPIIKHSGTLIFGTLIVVATLNIPCRYFKLMTPMLLLVSFVMLVLVLFIGEKTNGASRQMSILGMSMQPSEIAKGSLVLAVAQILSAMQQENGAARKAFKYILCLTAPMAFLIMIENLSTAVLLCFVIFLMMIIGRVPAKQLGKLMGWVALAVFTVVMLVMLVGHDTSKDKGTLAKTEQVETKPKERGTLGKIFHRADTWKTRMVKFNDEIGRAHV